MKYYLVQLTNTYTSEGQEYPIAGALNKQCYLGVTDDGGSNIGFFDLDGTPFELPEVQESRVIDRNPERQAWMG